MTVYAAVEGIIDEAVAKRIMGYLGVRDVLVINAGGKTQLKKQIRAYSAAARHSPWFVLADLDSPERCPIDYVREWLPDPNPQMILRFAVPAIEAWLLASRIALARYMKISVDLITNRPEQLPNPKLELISLAGRSRSRRIREDMKRPDGRIGPAYAARVIEFVSHDWNIEEAMKNADSLRRCVEALRRVAHTNI
jgi:hypothetical protein